MPFHFPSKRKLLLVYLLILGLSTMVRFIPLDSQESHESQKTIRLPEFTRSGTPTGDTIQMAYAEYKPSRPDAPTLVMVHGSPVASKSLDPLVEQLKGKFHLLVPDLPGFGNSTQSIENYSARAHAHYLLRWLEKLEVNRTHLLGYSMGGAVVLNMSARSPEKVQSLIMLAGVGVQETELTGDYTLNHALHMLQLIGLWSFQNLTPHFGLLDHVLLDTHYARNFYDTDQRPLRRILKRMEHPLLLLHGKKDRLVPPVTALEHHRIVPHSELVLFEGNHLTPIHNPEQLASPIEQFLARVKSGAALTRSEALVKQASQKNAPKPPYQLRYEGQGLILIVVLLALATFFSEDLTCIAAGILAAKGVLPMGYAILACYVGILLGDLWLFLIGRWFGRRALRKWPMRKLFTPARLRISENWLKKYGVFLIFMTRFVPGSRIPTYFAAGMLGRHFGRYLLCFMLSTAIWTPFLVWLGSTLGAWMLEQFDQYDAYALPLLLLTALAIYLFVQHVIPLTTWRGRCIAHGTWLRLYRWEYWPRWALYAPVLMYIFMYLTPRFRGIRTCTIINPSFGSASGLVGESKGKILDHFTKHGAPVATYRKLSSDLPLEERYKMVEQYHGGAPSEDRPCVLKPDKGERGRGVRIIKSAHEARQWLSEHAEQDALVQEYVPGEEYGVLYYRMPDEQEGHLFSLAYKDYTTVEGDGESTLEALILRNPRTRPHAISLLERFADQLPNIPDAGEKIPVVDIGTHARGATFYDANDCITPELEQSLNRACADIPDFTFGRLDIKVPTLESLQAGRDWKILEVNGLTSEPAHIYDPKHRVWQAWQTLFTQWRIAYTIGLELRKRGASLPTRTEVIKLILNS